MPARLPAHARAVTRIHPRRGRAERPGGDHADTRRPIARSNGDAYKTHGHTPAALHGDRNGLPDTVHDQHHPPAERHDAVGDPGRLPAPEGEIRLHVRPDRNHHAGFPDDLVAAAALHRTLCRPPSAPLLARRRDVFHAGRAAHPLRRPGLRTHPAGGGAEAVWEIRMLDQAITSELMIKPMEDGSFQYLSNKVIRSDQNANAGWYMPRLTEEEWEENYSNN